MPLTGAVNLKTGWGITKYQIIILPNSNQQLPPSTSLPPPEQWDTQAVKIKLKTQPYAQ